MAGLEEVTAASIDPVTVAELRAYARIDDTIDAAVEKALRSADAIDVALET